MTELCDAVKSMNCGKSPGPDGLTVEALKLAYKAIPDGILALMNTLLRKMRFPNTWQVPRVILLSKEGRDPNESFSYRPICVINTFAKLYERLIINRLNTELEENRAISPNQHGLRRRRSMVTAVLQLKNSLWHQGHAGAF